MKNTEKNTTNSKANSKRLMLNGIGFVSGDPTVTISYPYVHHIGTRVCVSEIGEAKWIYLMLPLCKGDLITNIRIAYRKSDAYSDIDIVRLLEIDSPSAATILYEHSVLEKTAGNIMLSIPCNEMVNTSVVLQLCLKFARVEDIIEIGTVEIAYMPSEGNSNSQGRGLFRNPKNKKSGLSLQSRISKILFFKL